MIHVKRDRVPVPVVLITPNDGGLREREEAITFFTDSANRQKNFEFKAYNHDTVKKALGELFHFKCAYCESPYAATQPVDVEHFRPKAGVVVNGKLNKPGYYWLAADWENLLPSCIDCNRARTQEIPDEDPRVVGKANKFPIENEVGRASVPNEEAQELRLLLHPCLDQPEEHLEFIEDGVVKPALQPNGQESRMAKESIEVYGLQRTGLVESRGVRLKLILLQIRRVSQLIELLDRNPNIAGLSEMIRAEIKELDRLQEDEQPYACMARQFVKRLRNVVQ